MTLPDFQPTLTGKTVIIRPLRRDDWSPLFAAASDPAIWELHPTRDRYTEPVFRRYFDGAIASGMAFAFVERAGGEMIGSSRYHGFDPVQSEIEIGWTFLVRRHWGGHTNREIKRLMLDHAFTFVDTVIFWVGENNLRSRTAMKKIGGVLRDGLFVREATGDAPHVIFEIDKRRYRDSGGLRD
jgi:N-acetyltransferase